MKKKIFKVLAAVMLLASITASAYAISGKIKRVYSESMPSVAFSGDDYRVEQIQYGSNNYLVFVTNNGGICVIKM